MNEVGEWVEFSIDSVTFRGFVIGPAFFGKIKVEVLGMNTNSSYKSFVYEVPPYQLKRLSSEFHKYDHDMLIDMALASGNKGLFQSLVGSESVIN